ncbi:hypothetical protein CMO91_00860 [Candidatus Woesearchaeota archaeon]|nr:hypothetical protein [Candidatus Woesearchaeota archaeon]|tara:strand:+ start:189 stop:449 length:261 start_codon:yes stop_codon:yes gene_type:complete
MYADHYSVEITKKLSKLRKKDPTHFSKVKKKMETILNNPDHDYKQLRYDMKGLNRIHLGHFVLIFVIDHEKKAVSFEDYDHHDNIY